MSEEIHEISGAKTLGHKPNYECLTLTLLKRAAARLTLGMHYGKHNWKKGTTSKEYALDRLNHAVEHLFSAIGKIDNGEPIGDDDLAAVVVNCMFAMEYQEWVKGYTGEQQNIEPGQILHRNPSIDLTPLKYQCRNCGAQFDYAPLKVKAGMEEHYFDTASCLIMWSEKNLKHQSSFKTTPQPGL